MKYDFDQIIDRRGSGCFKYDALKMMYGRDDLLSLWVADMDFAIAPEITKALQERLQHPVLGYNLRLDPFYNALIYWMKSRFSWDIHRDWTISTPGIVPALNLAVLALTNDQDGVLIQTPVYQPFYEAVTANNRKLLTNPLICDESGYHIDWKDLESKLQHAKMFLLCTPHNPVGRVWTLEELTAIGRLCRKYNVIIVSDDIHADLVYTGYKHIPISSLEDFADITITCMSPSKSFNIAGLGTSVALIPNPEIRRQFNALNFKLHLYLGNSFGITAFTAAYGASEAWLDALLVYLEANRDYLCEYIEQRLPMLKVYKPESTFLVWIDFSALRMDDEQLFDLITNKARVALDPGTKFGEGGERFMRLNFGCPRTILTEALERIESVIK